MRLEKYVDKSIKRRKIILISISLIVLISISFLLYKTFAVFNEHVEFPMMNGKVDYFGNSDIYFVFYKNGELVEDMPQKYNVDNIGFDHAECTNGASILWNEEEWAPLVKGLSSPKTKCNLYFEKLKYYVSTTGSDESNGNKESPLRTIKEAYERIVTRGTIILLSNIEESEGLEFNSNKNVTITSEDGTYEIDRSSSLTDKPIIELTNNNNLTLTNVIINGKEIESKKPLIVVNNSSLTVNEGTVIENGINNGAGGGIRTLSDSKLILNGGEIKNNQAQYGGGIGIHGKTYFEMYGGSVINNRTNNITSNGAGIHIATGGENGSVINIKDGLISKNISQATGGGLGISNNCGEIEINITGGTISENEAATNGAGLDLSNGIKTIINITAGTFENNKAKYGGGIYLRSTKEGESTNKITNATIKGNNAISGGGIYIQSDVKNATYEIDGATIEENIATKPENSNGGAGGAIRFNGKDTTHVLTISNVNIINNRAHDGGGIYSTGKLILNSGNIEKNNTISSGGGIFIWNKSEFEMNGGQILENQASNHGGGIYINTNGQSGLIFNFNAGEISNNTASNYGGGLKYNASSGEAILNLKGTNFIGNTAGNHGGGMHIENKNPLHFEMSDGSISENTSTNNSGGGIYISALGENNTYNITGGEITKNEANVVGGGMRYLLLASNNTFNISNVIISENTATYDGGGMYLGAEKTEFVNNIINLKSGEIKGNKTTNRGAGIYLQKSLIFNMSGGNVINNTSSSATGIGGIYSESGNVTYNKTGGTIDGNIPSDVGGIATN